MRDAHACAKGQLAMCGRHGIGVEPAARSQALRLPVVGRHAELPRAAWYTQVFAGLDGCRGTPCPVDCGPSARAGTPRDDAAAPVAGPPAGVPALAIMGLA